MTTNCFRTLIKHPWKTMTTQSKCQQLHNFDYESIYLITLQENVLAVWLPYHSRNMELVSTTDVVDMSKNRKTKCI